MNALKTVFLLCAVLGASCSAQYLNNQQGQQQSAPWTSTDSAQGASIASSSYSTFSGPSAAPQGSPMEAPVDFAQSSSTEGSCSSSGQSADASSTAAGSASTVHRVCSCVTIDNLPATPQVPAPAAAGPVDGDASVASSQQAAPIGQQNTYSALQTFPQTQTAPNGQQNTYSAPQTVPQIQTSFNKGY